MVHHGDSETAEREPEPKQIAEQIGNEELPGINEYAGNAPNDSERSASESAELNSCEVILTGIRHG
jgi:hypothetical protein